jgi:hypothetical protein
MQNRAWHGANPPEPPGVLDPHVFQFTRRVRAERDDQ